ncbi:MAG: hypothetical protein LBI87_14220 [Candidatus Accumulibacter sp.]|jgi:hypothetical protein|nr:hypothetical protein [Accumulibacter sp.]
MKRFFVFLFACTLLVGISFTGQASAVQSGGKQIITEERKVGEGSEAWEGYQAKSLHEEFFFDKSDTLTLYVKVYAFRDGANTKRALEYITDAGFKAQIEGNSLVVSSANYLGFKCSEYKIDEIKKRLDAKSIKYEVK